jgi:ABC-type multidrug transport system permease subunit
MWFLWNAAEKDLRRHLRDPVALALWAGIPLLIGGLITIVFGGLDRAPPTPHLLVANEDTGILGDLFARAFRMSDNQQFLRVEEVSRDTGRERINRGEATAMLVIPAGFVSAVLKEEPTTLLLVTNPSQRIGPQIVEEGLGILTDGAFYLHRIAGSELHDIVRGPPAGKRTFSDEDVSRISAAINKIVGRLDKYLFPPVIRVDAAVDEQRSGPKLSIVELFLPGILFMALVFIAEGLSADVWRERDQGTMRRAACTPAATVALLGGKLLAGAVVMFACGLVALLVGMLYLGTPLSRLPLALAWSVCAGIIFLLLLMLIQLHASSQRAGGVLSNSILMPLLFVGGSFFPFEAMPEWMAAIGRWTPNGWALGQLKEILFGRENAVALAVAFAVLLFLGAFLFVLSELRLRRAFMMK